MSKLMEEQSGVQNLSNIPYKTQKYGARDYMNFAAYKCRGT